MLSLTENGTAVIEGVSGISATLGAPNSPQTGDNSLPWLWAALLLISFVGVLAIPSYLKKNTENLNNKDDKPGRIF